MTVKTPPRPNAAQRLERRVATLTIWGPTVGTAAAIAWSATAGVSALELGLLAGFYALTMLGITAGYHRHFTHRSFQAHPAVRWVLGALGAMAAQGPVLFWVAAHRRHHQHADGPGDPHSPWTGDETPRGGLAGFWHAHVGWMLRHAPDDWLRTVPDLLRDDVAMGLNQTYFHWIALGLAAPALIGALATQSWQGALGGFLWGGCVRLFLVHHATWLVNSWCHMLGARPHDTADRSTNAFACAVLTFGEGWHNNHHAVPASARHGWTWRQPDPTWALIRTLERLGLASRVITPPTPTTAPEEQAS
ncbi:MAG: acyl-CoA desaturase [Candidatus Sericytochromatia bacterium]